jgi:hypothetical protein
MGCDGDVDGWVCRVVVVGVLSWVGVSGVFSRLLLLLLL